MSSNKVDELSIFQRVITQPIAFRFHPRGILILRERLGIFACFQAPRWQAGAELWTTLAR